MSLTIVKPSKYVSEKLLQRALEEVFSYLADRFEVSVKFACEDCITKLNHKYRSVNKPTNVLSFNAEGAVRDGDIVICESVVEREASNLNFNVGDLDLLYFVHGVLHLAGFDHEKEEDRAKMESIEKEILGKLGIDIER